ncbi:MAG: alkaline phosphatase family protein [Actinomycetota bacterium]
MSQRDRGPAAGAARARRATLRMPARAIGAVVVVAVVALATLAVRARRDEQGPLPSFRQQACGLADDWLRLTRRGHFGPRSGQVALLPEQPAYMASGAGGWSHSGPWPYLTHVPLVFYGPGIVPARGDVDTAVTLADIAPTIATLLKGSLPASDGAPLGAVARLDARQMAGSSPKLVVTIVWDGGGWNVLEQWPNAWPNLRRMMAEGVSYTNASVGSSPSVTPAVHTTIGTGRFPSSHGITGVPVRDESGEVVDAFLKGESSRFIQVPTLAELWDEQSDDRALIGMVGYEPWHLGMIGKGAEREGGDKDDAVWLNIETNEWITNPEHYRLPPSIPATEGLEGDIERTDAADGRVDGAWRDHAILDDPGRIEELPGFIRYHERALENLVRAEGYGRGGPTDLLFTNFKQIDRDGHYYNMASEEVRDTVVASDEALGAFLDFLDEEVGRGSYVVALTADHGQQPDAPAVDGYGIDPNEVENDVNAEFGPIMRAVWPTEAFLYPDVMEERGVTVEEVARFLGDLRLEDNTKRPDIAVAGAGRFAADDRLFALAIPAGMLPGLRCTE